VIGHALAFAPRPATQVAWDRAISIGFSTTTMTSISDFQALPG